MYFLLKLTCHSLANPEDMSSVNRMRWAAFPPFSGLWEVCRSRRLDTSLPRSGSDSSEERLLCLRRRRLAEWRGISCSDCGRPSSLPRLEERVGHGMTTIENET